MKGILRLRKFNKKVKELIFATQVLVTVLTLNAYAASSNTSNISINITPQAPPGISNGIITLLSYVDWAVLVGAIAAILVGILHLTGLMGDSSGAKKYIGGGILALIFWAGLFAFIHGLI